MKTNVWFSLTRFRMNEVNALGGLAGNGALEALQDRMNELVEERRMLAEETDSLALELESDTSKETWDRAVLNQKKIRELDEMQQKLVVEQMKISQRALSEASRLRQLIMETGELTAGHMETDEESHRIPMAASTPWSRVNVSSDQSMARSIQQAIESSSSSITKSMLKVEPCEPSAGSLYISMVEWKRWRALLLVTLSTVPGLSEAEKKVVFLRSAGSTLLDIFESLPDAVSGPSCSFTDIMSKLDAYFGSDACIRLARLTFKELSQLSSESNVDFIARLMKNIKGCGYGEDYMEDHLMDVIARKSIDPDIRKETQTYDRVTGKRCNYNQLREFALQLESIRRMEKEHASYERKSASVNALESLSSGELNRDSYTRQRERGWLGSRNPSRVNRSKSNLENADEVDNRQRDCDCCGSYGHSVRECRHNTKKCNNCGRIGHLARKCPRSSLKRTHSSSRHAGDSKDNGSDIKFAGTQNENEVEN